jgi:hypothetical protein
MRATVLSAVPLQDADMPSSTAMVVASCWSDRYLKQEDKGRGAGCSEVGLSKGGGDGSKQEGKGQGGG